jgi:hypothetical protein
MAVNRYYIITGHVGGFISYWLLSISKLANSVQLFSGNDSDVGSMLLIEGNTLYTVSLSGRLAREYIPRPGLVASSFPLFCDAPSKLHSVAVDSNYIFIAGDTPFTIFQFNATDGVLMGQLQGHTDVVNDLLIFSKYLFSASDDRSIIQWDIRGSVIKVRSWRAHSGPVKSIAGDGFYLYTGSDDGKVKQWQIPELMPAAEFAAIDFPSRKLSSTTFSLNSAIKTAETTTTTAKKATKIAETTSTTTTHAVISKTSDVMRRPTGGAKSPTLEGDTPSSSNTDQTETYVVIGGSAAAVSLILIAGIFIMFRRRPNEFLTGVSLSTESPPFPTRNVRINSLYSSNVPRLSNATSKFVPSEVNESHSSVYTGMSRTIVNSKHRGLYVPGNYLLDTHNMLYKPQRLIYANVGCDVHCALALDAELQKRCRNERIAVKILKKLNSFSAEAFYQEVSIMYFFVGKPNFVQLVGFCNAPYQILTDYYAFGSLEQCLIKNRLITHSKHVIVSFAVQICRAIQLMHSSGFAHADIKAMNIFVDIDNNTGDFHCYLGDFGLSQVLDDAHLQVKAYRVLNTKGLTVPYAAPEILLCFRAKNTVAGGLDGGHSLDFKRSDVYSLGILMFEIANGSLAWKN